MACCKGPGYETPLDAFNEGPKEKLLYVIAVSPDQTAKADYLATVDVDPDSATYSQVISRLKVPHVGDELHHFGWNACSSCYHDGTKKRSKLVLPGFSSGRIYIVDVLSNEREPKLHKVIEESEVLGKTGLTNLHTSHCLGSGDILISALGDGTGEAKGGFVLLDEQFNVKGSWTSELTAYGYDYWYQPRHNIMVSSEFGAPGSFFKGFNPAEASTRYGSKLYFWDWEKRKLLKEIDLGADGLIPLEVRFAHDPNKSWGFVGAALSSNIILIYKDEATGEWLTKTVIKQDWVEVEGWALPTLPPLITDILISLDDRFLYFSNWLRGDLVQYDITDPHNPKFVDRVWLGGSIKKGGPVKVLGKLPADVAEAPEPRVIKGVTIQGGPQMIQLSLDGRRLYATNSLLTPWDSQFYPDLVKHGSQLVLVETDPVKGGLKVNEDFLVDFGAEPDGPYLAHESRYPGGDCSSDIWV